MYLTYFNGQWNEGNVPLFGAMDHSVWLGSSVFDGARAIRPGFPPMPSCTSARWSSAAKVSWCRCLNTAASP